MISPIKISLDFYNNSIVRINSKQLDTKRSVNITCTDNGKKIDLNKDTMSVYVGCEKTDGNYGFYEAEILNDGTILWQIKEQVLAISGVQKIDVCIVATNGIMVDNLNDITSMTDLGTSLISTMPFYINNISSAINREQIESTSEIDALNDVLTRLAYTEQHLKEVDSNLNENEDERKSNEEARKAQEESRQSAEAKRKTDTNDAINRCNKATDFANNAAEAANYSKNACDTATDNANDIIEKAKVATASANEASKKAELSATKAESATTSANEAATKAESATTFVNEAVGKAESAKDACDVATVEANDAAKKANDAAKLCQSVLDGTTNTLHVLRLEVGNSVIYYDDENSCIIVEV